VIAVDYNALNVQYFCRARVAPEKLDFLTGLLDISNIRKQLQEVVMRGIPAQLTGKRFGKLTVVKRIGSKNRRSLWLCYCDCGKTRKATTHDLGQFGVSACTRCTKEAQYKKTAKALTGRMLYKGDPKYRATIGKTPTPTYAVFKSMHDRCKYKSNASYHAYGCRGIIVCKRWDSFKNFVDDMGLRPDGMTLDRIDNEGNYEPNNCRWVTPKTNARKRRNSNILTYKAESLCIAEWAEKMGVGWGVIDGRIKRGWSVEESITKPVDARYRNKKWKSCK